MGLGEVMESVVIPKVSISNALTEPRILSLATSCPQPISSRGLLMPAMAKEYRAR
jgi:hypothetical protein